VLDVGCGSGVITSHLGKRGARAIGIDANPRAIDFARERFGTEDVSFHLGLVDEAFSLDCRVDKIYCLELIEHVYRPQAVTMLERFRGLLRPGGSLFLTTPNYRSMWPIMEWIMDRSGRFPAMAGAQHVEFYRGETLRGLCRDAGFEPVSVVSMGVVSPWLAFLSWRAAERCLDLELRFPLLVGPVLVCLARQREA